jgi:hypothetical protein
VLDRPTWELPFDCGDIAEFWPEFAYCAESVETLEDEEELAPSDMPSASLSSWLFSVFARGRSTKQGRCSTATLSVLSRQSLQKCHIRCLGCLLSLVSVCTSSASRRAASDRTCGWKRVKCFLGSNFTVFQRIPREKSLVSILFTNSGNDASCFGCIHPPYRPGQCMDTLSRFRRASPPAI